MFKLKCYFATSFYFCVIWESISPSSSSSLVAPHPLRWVLCALGSAGRHCGDCWLGGRGGRVRSGGRVTDRHCGDSGVSGGRVGRGVGNGRVVVGCGRSCDGQGSGRDDGSGESRGGGCGSRPSGHSCDGRGSSRDDGSEESRGGGARQQAQRPQLRRKGAATPRELTRRPEAPVLQRKRRRGR